MYGAWLPNRCICEAHIKINHKHHILSWSVGSTNISHIILWRGYCTNMSAINSSNTTFKMRQHPSITFDPLMHSSEITILGSYIIHNHQIRDGLVWFLYA
jgi:hypothetical protein